VRLKICLRGQRRLRRAGWRDGHALEFTNPADGGPILPTIAAQLRLPLQGFATRPRQARDGNVFVVVSGRGTARIQGAEFALMERDCLVVPSWASLAPEAVSELVIIAHSDRAAQEKLGLWRQARA